MPELDTASRNQAEGPVRHVQPVRLLTKNAEVLTLSRTKNSGIQATSYNSNASSRATSPTTDGSYSSAPTSITSIHASMQLNVESSYQREDAEVCSRWSSDETYPPVDRMTFIGEDTRDTVIDKSPLTLSRPVRNRSEHAMVYPNSINRIWPLDSNDPDSRASQTGHEDIEDTDERSESIDEYDGEDDDYEDEYLQYEDNEWSGEDGGLEELVISVVEGDLTFAVSLIPTIHRYMTSRLRSKVESWQSCATGESHGSSRDGNSGISSGSGQHDASPNSRKRRLSSDHDDNLGEGEDEDKDGEGHGQPADHIASPDGTNQPMLACPFNKHNPTKYCATDRKYRTCTGPGFKNIQRLREHLKRTHYLVQCDRCYHIFPSNDKNRASAMDALTTHRQAEVSCLRGDPSLKEGISDAQWAALDAQNRKTNKNQGSHRTEKWTEIWRVLFPGEAAPTPWYENIIAKTFSNRPASSSQQIEDFVNMCILIVNHKARDLIFQDGQLTMSSQEILKNMLRQACMIWTGLNRPIPGSQASSSLNRSNNHSSLASSSSTNLTVPTTCTPVSHASIQTSGPSAQAVPGSHNTDVNQPLAKRSRTGGRSGLMDNSPSTPQATTSLANMAMPVHGLRTHFISRIPTALQPSTCAGTQISLDDYQPVIPDQWQIHVTGGFMEPNIMSTSNMNVFHDQPWPTDAQYGTFENTFPVNEVFFPQSQDFGQGGDMAGDIGDMRNM